jgi:glutathione S-transferase
LTTAFYLTVLVTAVALLIYIWTSILVGRARGIYNVKAPATTGAEGFERAYRVQQNTLEQLVLFLPVLWLAHVMTGTIWPAIIGTIWPVGRIIYAFSYMAAPEKRGPGFLLTMVPSLVLLGWVLALAVINLV